MAESLTMCVPVMLPEDVLSAAIAEAASINPANAINELTPVKPQHLAVLRSSYWGPKGIKLGVGFLETASAGTKRKILEHANAWGKHANVVFKEAAKGSAEVRIAFQRGGGYWSYLGTDVLQIPAGQPTMNLEGFTENTSEGEYKRVVRHEFGHTCGFPHEHMRKEIIDKIIPAEAYKLFKRTSGWSKQMVDSQVLTPLPESKILATAHARANSIMCYQLPGSIMNDGKDVPGGNDIDKTDYDLARKLYPKMT